MTAPKELLDAFLERRLAPPARTWLAGARAELSKGVAHARFAELVSIASRHAPRAQLAPSADERASAREVAPGWNPERWTTLDAVRAALVLAREDLATRGVVDALEECFAYADVGELCALHKTLQLLPERERFTWRAGEGCRSSMRAVYESAACDTGLPAACFDDLAWRQLVIKALFVEAPLWRVYGLDRRLDDELARMALDLCDERRSAGRPVQHELWLVVGAHGGARALAAIEKELTGTNALGRRAAAIALARAGKHDRLAELARAERDPAVRATMEEALRGTTTQEAFRALDPAEARA